MGRSRFARRSRYVNNIRSEFQKYADDGPFTDKLLLIFLGYDAIQVWDFISHSMNKMILEVSYH